MFKGIDAEVERLNLDFIGRAGDFYILEKSKLYAKLNHMGVKMNLVNRVSYDLYPTFVFVMADIYRLALWVHSTKLKQDSSTVEDMIEALLDDFIESLKSNHKDYIKQLNEINQGKNNETL